MVLQLQSSFVESTCVGQVLPSPHCIFPLLGTGTTANLYSWLCRGFVCGLQCPRLSHFPGPVNSLAHMSMHRCQRGRSCNRWNPAHWKWGRGWEAPRTMHKQQPQATRVNLAGLRGDSMRGWKEAFRTVSTCLDSPLFLSCQGLESLGPRPWGLHGLGIFLGPLPQLSRICLEHSRH